MARHSDPLRVDCVRILEPRVGARIKQLIHQKLHVERAIDCSHLVDDACKTIGNVVAMMIGAGHDEPVACKMRHVKEGLEANAFEAMRE